MESMADPQHDEATRPLTSRRANRTIREVMCEAVEAGRRLVCYANLQSLAQAEGYTYYSFLPLILFRIRGGKYNPIDNMRLPSRLL